MAGVLDALAPYVNKLITDMAEDEVSRLLGAYAKITKLEDNMEGLKAFLADAERRRITDMSVQKWVTKLKNAMYDATDILDLCHLEAEKQGRESNGGSLEEKVPGCFQPLLFCLRNPVFAHKIGGTIDELNQRLDNIYKEALRFKFITDLSPYPEQRRASSAEHSSPRMTSEYDESAIVGDKIDKETRELAQLLIASSDHDIKVVSIVGMGGMGKTTLAQKIFNQKNIQEHFKVKVWLSITQHFNQGELLRAAIKHAHGDQTELQDMTLLTRTLTDSLSKGRFLLVMDDVWGGQAWNDVLSVPIRNASRRQQGNWVLMTTRFGDLASQMSASFYQHYASPLNHEDAWSLLKKQLPPPPNHQAVGMDHLKVVGMKIIEKCGGLPLAIKVMGGLLNRRPQSESEWEAVLNHRAWSVDGLPEELDKRIYLSYEDLSPQLKQCFLYCSLFPKGTRIVESIVIPMWISEGFIQAPDGSSSHDDRLEEIATEYYRELITRNLLEPTGRYNVTWYKCTMHDVVRSFAESMAKGESLVLVDDKHAVGSNKNNNLVRRLSIGPTRMASDWAVLHRQKGSLRTLITINSVINFRSVVPLTSFSRLRSLFIKYADCDESVLVATICQLTHLRYLRLEKTNVSRLPDDIHRMKFLQHIVLRKCSCLNILPRSIVELIHLRTINLRGSNDNIVIPKGFGRLASLRTLYGFPVHMGDGDWCSLEEIGPLSRLRGLTLHLLENVSAGSFCEKAMIQNKERLSYLELNWRSSRIMGWRDDDDIDKQQQQQHVAEEVLKKLCPPPCIQHLQIGGYFGRSLPNWMMVPATAGFGSLRYLALICLPCCNKLPCGLRRLPILEWLQIKDAPAIKTVGPEFQASSLLAAAFPSLRTFDLSDLCEWEEWNWEDATAAMAMPVLRTLTIKKCKLSCLPAGLGQRHALREVILHELTNLICVENFPSVIYLELSDCTKLKRISCLSMLQKIRMLCCPNVHVLESVPALDSLELEDTSMEMLPEYLREVKPTYLGLYCSRKMYGSLSSGSSEWNKISHIAKHSVVCIEV